jgi:ribonuclease BN (tRNA processing enzyme)
MSGMRLTVLGCSGSLPRPDSPASGYLLRADGFAMALDLGNGTRGNLQRHVDPFGLGALALTHLHADHCADIAGLIVYLRYHPSPPVPRPPLPVYGPSETARRLAAVYASSAAELDEDHSDVLNVHTLGSPMDVGPFHLTSAPVAHASEAYALRLEHGGVTLVYTGDSGPCPELARLATGADVLLCEATWTDDPGRPKNLHLSGVQAGQLATEAGVGRLLLTHVPPWTEPSAVLAEARRVFDGPVELVGAGRSYEV